MQRIHCYNTIDFLLLTKVLFLNVDSKQSTCGLVIAVQAYQLNEMDMDMDMDLDMNSPEDRLHIPHMYVEAIFILHIIDRTIDFLLSSLFRLSTRCKIL